MQKQTCDNGSKQRKKKCMQNKIRTSKWVKQLKVFKCRKRERIEQKERKRKNSFLLFISNMEATKQLTAIKRVDNSPTLTNPLSFPSLPSLQPSQQPESQTSSRTSTSNSRTPKILLWAICALIKCPAASASLLNLVAFVRFDVGWVCTYFSILRTGVLKGEDGTITTSMEGIVIVISMTLQEQVSFTVKTIKKKRTHNVIQFELSTFWAGSCPAAKKHSRQNIRSMRIKLSNTPSHSTPNQPLRSTYTTPPRSSSKLS